jgi:Leucine-rich repeat (LRR) protein
MILFTLAGCAFQSNSKTTEVDLSNQNLVAIPDSIFSMTHLEHLQLGNNFTMYPPLSALGADEPEGEDLNKIVKIPGSIKVLHKLRFLSVRFNDLKSLPNEISELRALDTLDLSFNEHLNIAAEFETLRKMTWLKCLNIVATNTDTTTVSKLRKALLHTKIETMPEDL